MSKTINSKHFGRILTYGATGALLTIAGYFGFVKPNLEPIEPAYKNSRGFFIDHISDKNNIILMELMKKGEGRILAKAVDGRPFYAAKVTRTEDSDIDIYTHPDSLELIYKEAVGDSVYANRLSRVNRFAAQQEAYQDSIRGKVHIDSSEINSGK